MRQIPKATLRFPKSWQTVPCWVTHPTGYGLFIWVCFFCSLALAQSREKPNFILISTDDQGYADLSCFGGAHVNTPRIDQMAAEGLKLTSFYVASSSCTPSRAALMTGCYPKRVGVTRAYFVAGDKMGLSSEEITIAEVLKIAGYRPALFGKWHLGDQPEFLPTRQGFDEFFGLPYSHDIHPFHYNTKRFRFPPLPLMEMEQVIKEDPDADFLTKRITERSVRFINKHKDQPFFLHIPHPLPHRPVHVSPAFMEQVSEEVKTKLKDEQRIDYETRDQLYNQAVNEIDWSVGEILDALKQNDIDDKTLVVFTSDNGPKVGKATPLRGWKGSTFEGGMRVPTVIRWPEKIPAGQSNDEIMTAMDLLPTFASLAGARLPSDRVIDGKDIGPVWFEDQPSPHEAFFYYTKDKVTAVRSGKWKLHMGKDAGLYDLDADIGEQQDLSSHNSSLVEELNYRAKIFDETLKQNLRSVGLVENPKTLTTRKDE